MANDTQTELQVIVLAKMMMKHSVSVANNQNRAAETITANTELVL